MIPNDITNRIYSNVVLIVSLLRQDNGTDRFA